MGMKQSLREKNKLQMFENKKVHAYEDLWTKEEWTI
jgi:hypothetical protein